MGRFTLVEAGVLAGMVLVIAGLAVAVSGCTGGVRFNRDRCAPPDPQLIVDCADNLRLIGFAMSLYAADNAGELPSTLPSDPSTGRAGLGATRVDMGLETASIPS